LDADIQKCFNEINHNVLLSKLDTFPNIKKQIIAWLKVDILKHGSIEPVKKGKPQGSIISPLLMNIAFHGMEEAVINFMKNLKIKGSGQK